MKKLLLLLMLAFPLMASAQIGSWTLYYTDTEVVNSDGSVTITPTVSLTGSDGGGYCDPLNDCDGYEQPLVMLNGNQWVAGEIFDAGDSVYLTNTFPNVTVAEATVADLSYAGLVEGASKIIQGGGSNWINPSLYDYYLQEFQDGVNPPWSTWSPCWIIGNIISNSAPDCPSTWVNPFTGLAAGYHPANLDSQQVAQTVSNPQVPTYFFSPSAAQTSTPPACVQEGYTGYFIDISYYVADANSNRISQSGMAPGENVGSGWNDAFASPTTTRSDGSFDDTPVGACYETSGHFCAAGHPQSFRLTSNGTVFPIATNTTSKDCTDGIQLVIQGNPAAQNKTYTFGDTQ